MRDYNETEWNIVYETYVNQRRGLAYCSKLINSTIGELKYNLTQHGIHIRTQREATIATNQNRATDKNRDYFKIQSSNMAWLLGFLASDGTIRKDSNEIKIGLARKDKEILEKIRQELALTTTVKDYVTTNGYECSTLQWTCAEHKQDLAEYYIIPAKTFQLKPPDKLNPKYYIDYIRGYFDGDGSISLMRDSHPDAIGNLRWQICSATPELLEWIVNVLYEQFNIPKVKLQKRIGTTNLYLIQYSTNSTKKIYNILYTPNSLYLARKKEHFDEIIKLKNK